MKYLSADLLGGLWRFVRHKLRAHTRRVPRQARSRGWWREECAAGDRKQWDEQRRHVQRDCLRSEVSTSDQSPLVAAERADAVLGVPWASAMRVGMHTSVAQSVETKTTIARHFFAAGTSSPSRRNSPGARYMTVKRSTAAKTGPASRAPISSATHAVGWNRSGFRPPMQGWKRVGGDLG